MRQRKLFKVLSLLEEAQYLDFRNFLDSPYFNNSKTLVRFFELWEDQILLKPESEDPSVETFLEGTSIQSYRMDKLCSQLYSKALEFFAQEEFKSRDLLQDEMLLAGLDRRNPASSELKKQYSRIQKKLKKRPLSTERNIRQLNFRWLSVEATVKNREIGSSWKENLKDLHTDLDEYYTLQKLKLICAAINLRLIYNQGDEDPGKTFLAQLQASGRVAELSSLSRAYYLTVQMSARDKREEAFQALIDLLGEKAIAFEEEEARELYGYAINFCIRKHNEGFLEYRVHTASLYRQLLATGLLLEDKKLWPHQMKNLVSIHCQIGELDWVKNFLEEYADLLPEEVAEYALNYNTAVLAFHEQDYSTAIVKLKTGLANLKEDVFYGLDTRVYLWKSYFEHLAHLSIEEVDEMYRLYDAFRIFIDRNDSISAAHKHQYRNFIREFKRFMVILNKPPVLLDELLILKTEVTEMAFMANKGWFLEKLDTAILQQSPV